MRTGRGSGEREKGRKRVVDKGRVKVRMKEKGRTRVREKGKDLIQAKVTGLEFRSGFPCG